MTADIYETTNSGRYRHLFTYEVGQEVEDRVGTGIHKIVCSNWAPTIWDISLELPQEYVPVLRMFDQYANITLHFITEEGENVLFHAARFGNKKPEHFSRVHNRKLVTRFILHPLSSNLNFPPTRIIAREEARDTYDVNLPVGVGVIFEKEGVDKFYVSRFSNNGTPILFGYENFSKEYALMLVHRTERFEYYRDRAVAGHNELRLQNRTFSGFDLKILVCNEEQTKGFVLNNGEYEPWVAKADVNNFDSIVLNSTQFEQLSSSSSTILPSDLLPERSMKSVYIVFDENGRDFLVLSSTIDLIKMERIIPRND